MTKAILDQYLGSQGTKRFLSGFIAMLIMGLIIGGVCVFGDTNMLNALTGPLGVFAGFCTSIIVAGNWHDVKTRTAMTDAMAGALSGPKETP